VPGDFQPRDTHSVRERADALVAELARRGPVGRIEVVPMNGHEESVWVADQVPLARGWLRQLDTARSPLFYDRSLDAASYLRWLRASGASYVALPSGPLDGAGHQEAVLLRRGVPGVSQVWTDGWWRLYRVAGGAMVRGDAVLRASDRARVVVEVRARGRVHVAVWWSRWTSLSGPGGCARPGSRAGWTALEVDRPGRYVLTSEWRPHGRCGSGEDPRLAPS